MRQFLLSLLLVCTLLNYVFGQSTFPYSVYLEPTSINGLPGLQSYAWAQHNGKWLLIGGRKDGLHARQPFNAFPEAQNNTTIFVVDPILQQVWASSITSLPAAISEHLQSTNINFHQDADTLYLMGGYGYSPSAADHITYEKLTTVIVPDLINAVISGNPLSSVLFHQLTDTTFALTGGRLGKINDHFILVGGHRFNGRYNPMGNPTYTQFYSNQIRRFKITQAGSSPVLTNLSAQTDPVHLRRRDYNLVPQLDSGNQFSYWVSSGVFQPGADLPYLYPIDITDTGYTAMPSFNQYLSNYHSSYVPIYDSINQDMHTLFLGGLSQYYYQNGNLIQDNAVPFVKTISRITKNSSGLRMEYVHNEEMPAFNSAGSEFIPNLHLPFYNQSILKLDALNQDTNLIGFIFGGIDSPTLNPFSNNQTSTTAASSTLYRVFMVSTNPTNQQAIKTVPGFECRVNPNPVIQNVSLDLTLNESGTLAWYLQSMDGKLIDQGEFIDLPTGNQKVNLNHRNNLPTGTYLLSVTLNFKHMHILKVQVQ